VLLRCLAVPGLVPQPNQTNQIIRLVVEICDNALPDVVTFLKVDARSQNYAKFSAISLCHKQITDILTPLRQNYGDLDAVLLARKEIIGSLNHSLVRRYCGQFRLNEVKSTIEVIFSKLKKASAREETFLSDIEECNRCVDGAREEYSDSETFLTEDYLDPFLTTCRSVLSDFFIAQRAKFGTSIIWGHAGTRELQKRYPLYEPARQIQIVIPLRNLGPGLATEVRISVTSQSSSVVLGNETAMLGNVLPGEFSITVDAMVIAATDDFEGLMQVEWGEIGSIDRFTEIF